MGVGGGDGEGSQLSEMVTSVAGSWGIMVAVVGRGSRKGKTVVEEVARREGLGRGHRRTDNACRSCWQRLWLPEVENEVELGFENVG
ncbi:hypothetical protein CsSME_00038699 [Camellia sinensis var. sinensis]